MDRPWRNCAFPGCPELIRHKGYCPRHNERPDHNQVYDHRWRKISQAVREACPPCVRCGRPAQEIHHDQAIRHGGRRFDPANLIPLCVSCHVTITARTRSTPTSRRRTR